MAAAPFLGVLMLQTRFPRLPGDIGHEASLPFPVRRVVVGGASPARIVHGRDDTLLGAFVEAARALVAEGAAAISTSCGFVARWQPALQAALPVPVWSSSLLQLPLLPAGKAGVVTVDAAALGPAHFLGVGADPATPVAGLAPGGSLQRTLLEDRATLDAGQARAEVVEAAQRLLRGHPAIDHIVLECTNLPPYTDAVRAATGCTVHDILTVLTTRWWARSREGSRDG